MQPIEIRIVKGKVQAVQMWHPINGEWTLITQIIGDEHEFYTNDVKIGSYPIEQESEIVILNTPE